MNRSILTWEVYKVRTTMEILRTLTAKCRDCYRCVRGCPVDAIGIKDNQAYVDSERCILCGTCVKECPQHAKVFRDDTEIAADLIKNGKAIVSVAPSFSAIYGGEKASRIPSALRQLGFVHVFQTAEGAELVSQLSRKMVNEVGQKGCVSTACPAVVSYIEKYCPENVEKLLSVVSPMIAHARLLKKHFGPDINVIFIGPCIAKKMEAQRPEYQGSIDVVLTFSELDRWLEREKIQLESCAESDFDYLLGINHAKLFPLPGGMLKTMGISNDVSRRDIMHTSGMHNIQMLLGASSEVLSGLEMIEPLFCMEGCINGPGMESEENLFQRRTNLITYTTQQELSPQKVALTTEPMTPDLTTTFSAEEFIRENITEEQIMEVFRQTDKSEPEARLDCGACGYSSCLEKAKAVVRGMAEKEMCVPYMRKLAEQRTDKIIESSPSGIVILDESLQILSMNSSFCNYFTCNNSIIGKRISYLLDAHAYERLATGAADHIEEIISCYGNEFHQIVYKLPSENQYVGFYMDVSRIRMTEAKLDLIKQQTVEKAQELLDHQIKIAQAMAKFLGDSTARSEELVERLMSINEI